MNIQSQKQVKSIVSALRRELKASGPKDVDKLTHTECLEALSKALGFADWNTLKSKLPEEPVAAVAEVAPTKEPSRYLPSNEEGRYDFVAPGKQGMVYTGHFIEVQGTWDRLNGIALMTSAARAENQELTEDWLGSTEVCWDAQVTVYRDGEKLYCDVDGDLVPQSKLILVPKHSDDFSELPVRSALVEDFALALPYYLQKGVELATAIDSLEGDCGFSLTRPEREELERVMQSS